MPTIDEIAKLSNVSKTTVSRVLNDHPYVSEEKGSVFWKSSKIGLHSEHLCTKAQIQQNDVSRSVCPSRGPSILRAAHEACVR